MRPTRLPVVVNGVLTHANVLDTASLHKVEGADRFSCEPYGVKATVSRVASLASKIDCAFKIDGPYL